MSISNQKNGKWCQVIYQEVIHNDFHHILTNTSSQTTTISTCFQIPFCKGRVITATNINRAVTSAVVELGLDRKIAYIIFGLQPQFTIWWCYDRALTREINPNTVKKMGCWSSDTLPSLCAYMNNCQHFCQGIYKIFFIYYPLSQRCSPTSSTPFHL